MPKPTTTATCGRQYPIKDGTPNSSIKWRYDALGTCA
jgi:hypothetical protein